MPMRCDASLEIDNLALTIFNKFLVTIQGKRICPAPLSHVVQLRIGNKKVKGLRVKECRDLAPFLSLSLSLGRVTR